MSQKLVSVIMPVYNAGMYLGETLDSVLASDYTNIEVVLMDDGSKDGSCAIAREYAGRDPRVKLYTQPNGGPCVARNHAIELSRGFYILPVDADDKISPTFISNAVAAIEADPEVKMVTSRAEYFGDRTGEWKLAAFSRELLAHKNMLSISALYRKEDWERVGGYCAEIIAREDWAFWIAVLKDGGKVVKLPEVGLFYRIRQGSKRSSDRKLKHHVVDTLNKLHPSFFECYLGGRLRYNRSWSRLLNALSRIFTRKKVFVSELFPELEEFMNTLPERFESEGRTIYEGRNTLKEFESEGRTIIVKSYQKPWWFNRLVYRFLRPSKAERSFRYATLLRGIGVGSPAPVGYNVELGTTMLGRSYFACLKSECPYTYRHFAQRKFERQEDILRAIARTTARLHEAGILHKDYSAGNILFRDDLEEIPVEIIDLNRIRFCKVDIETGCRNFERLPGTEEMLDTMADEYAAARGFDAAACRALIRKYRQN